MTIHRNGHAPTSKGKHPPSDMKFSQFTIIPKPDLGSGCCVVRGGIMISLGVAAVIGIDVGPTVIVSHDVADGRIVVHAA